MSKVPPATSGSGKNALDREAFGIKVPETPVTESPAASAADVTSAATGTGTTAASEAEKAGTVRLPPPRVRAVTAAPLSRGRCHLHGASSTRAWRR
jgi:hypothetical protein